MLGTRYKKVELVNYQPSWRQSFQIEQKLIKKALVSGVVAIEHVGSTSIVNIYSKPTIDILAGLTDLKTNSFYESDLFKIGYQFRSDHPVPGRLHFAKVEEGLRLFNLSLCIHGQEFWVERISFKNHLIAHPETAQEYCELKQDLAEQYPNDTLKYTEGKSNFISRILKQINR